MNKKEIQERMEALAKEQAELQEELEYLLEQEANPWPREFTTYVYGDELYEDSSFQEFVREAGWSDDDDETKMLSRCSYEHELTYSVDKDGTHKLIRVDGRDLA